MPRTVTQVLRSSSVEPYDLPELKSGIAERGDTLQPILQFEPCPTIVHSTKDQTIRQLESIDKSVHRRQCRYLKRSYQVRAQNLMPTNPLDLSDDAPTTNLLLSNNREGMSQPLATAPPCRVLQNSTNPTVASRISPLSSIPKHGLLAPCSKTNASYSPVRSYGVDTSERPTPPSIGPRLPRASSSGTTIFTPPLIITASPNAEKSGTAQSSSSDSSGWSKEQMSFL